MTRRHKMPVTSSKTKEIPELSSLWLASFLLALTSHATPVFANSAQDCLTEAIYFEAGSRGAPGRLAVGHTILNRVESDDFPDSVCAVISQGEATKNCQFSYRCDGLAEIYKYPEQHRMARKAAQNILSGETEDPTRGALFFHSDRIPSGWFATRTRTGSFGGNIFYK